ncbi:hypothetical protein BDW22DRAFT_1356247 [Trametopsis cervina]|nr:hypothetical protein BDW22DRAFT_1356247 [Trametopsis cervina]
MAFGLTIGTERATALQTSIQDELTKRGYSPDADPVMAEYITIMIINNKTAAQIASELEDLIGSDFDPSFVDWLFAEVAKGAPESEAPTPVVPEQAPPVQTRARDDPPHLQNDSSSKPASTPRAAAPLYRQAIAQAMPSTSPSGQKRSASARSPSPSGHPNKSRRLDLPTGPRAMQHRDISGPSGSRSLLDRMGPSRHGRAHDEIQARIDSITGPPAPEMMMNGGFPMNGMPGMDMAAMGGMANPMMLQEMMMNQMAMMAQMAGAMGMLNPAAMAMNGQFPGQPGMNGDMGMMNGGMNGPSHPGPDGRGRGRGRGGSRGIGGRGRGGHTGPGHVSSESAGNVGEPTPANAAPAPVQQSPAAPAPIHSPAPQLATSLSQGRGSVAPPERPQSPTLCKFSLKCTNPTCRYSHPSPVATPESGVVLSNEACENGKNCKDKDCIKAHVSPAASKPHSEPLNPKAPAFTPTAHAPHHSTPQSQVACRFGAACTKPNCAFLHPARQNNVPCRFGAACTKATCTFQHPEGRSVLPTTFHRGLGGGVTNSTDSTASPHKSMTFNNRGATAAELEKKVKELEEKKTQAQAAVAQAQAAATKKDDSAKSVSVAV